MSSGAAQEGPARPTADEVDLRHLIEVLDVALSSDNPAVKDSLQKLLMIATLVSTEKPVDRLRGPLSRIFEEISTLRDKVRRLENEVAPLRGSRSDPELERMKRAIAGYPKPLSYPDKWEMPAKMDPEFLKKLLGKKDE